MAAWFLRNLNEVLTKDTHEKELNFLSPFDIKRLGQSQYALREVLPDLVLVTVDESTKD